MVDQPTAFMQAVHDNTLSWPHCTRNNNALSDQVSGNRHHCPRMKSFQVKNKTHSLEGRQHIDLVLHQNSSIFSAERLCFTQYIVHVVDLIPESVRPIVSRVLELPALYEAAIAFSTARLAYSLGTSYQVQSKILLRPQRELFVQSLKYFSQAIRLIQRNTSSSEDRLATVLFFILIENVIGTVRSYSCHLRGLETLILRNHRALSETPYGRLLLRAGLYARAKGALFLGPLHGLHRNEVSDQELDILGHHICAPQERLFLIVTDAIRISSRLLLEKCIYSQSSDIELVTQKISFSGYDKGRSSGFRHTDSETFQKLEDLSRHLETLFAESPSLHGAFLRCTSHPIFKRTEFSHTDDSIPPITFDNHDEAIVCAIYALIQVYCNRDLLQNLLSSMAGNTSLQLNRWAQVILGIAKGCGPPQYLYEERYHMNICWILGLLCLRWPNSDILTYITQNILPDLKSTIPVPEDTVGALLLFELVMEMLRTEIARGRKVFSIHLAHEDSSEDNGFFLVNKSLQFVIHGYTDDGSFFDDYVPALPQVDKS